MAKSYTLTLPDGALDLSGYIGDLQIIMWTTASGQLLLDFTPSLMAKWEVFEDVPPPPPPTIDRYRVLSINLNIREQPTTLSNIVRIYHKDDIIQITKERERWSRWLWGKLEADGWVALGEVNRPSDLNDHTIRIPYVQLITEGTGG